MEWIEYDLVIAGKRKEAIGEITQYLRAVPGTHLLNVVSTGDQVKLTLAGAPKAALTAAFRAIVRAVQLLNINDCKDIVGIVESCCFTPLENSTVAECTKMLINLGTRVAKLQIPVFMGKQGENHREIEKRARQNPFVPDYGPPFPHPTAGSIILETGKSDPAMKERFLQIMQEPLHCTLPFLENLASSESALMGGSAIALAASSASALAEKVASLAQKSQKAELENTRRHLLHLAREDSEARGELVEAKKLLEENEEKKLALENALLHAMIISLDIMKQALTALEILPEITKANPASIRETSTAYCLLAACARAASSNARFDLNEMEDENFKREVNEEIDAMLEKTEQAEIKKFCQEI